MEYQEFAPRPELAPYVRCFWTLRDAVPDGRPERIVPDGCCEIIVNRADPFRGRNGVQPLHMAVGQLQSHLNIVPTGVVDLLAVRFEPGGLYSFMDGAPMNELTERNIELKLRGVRTLAELEATLLARLRRSDGLVAEAARRIRRARGGVVVHRLARDLGVSERGLERAFAREVGLPPKRLARIERFQGVVRTVEATASLAWAAMAVECGYYDQAHLIRDFKHFAGVSPTAYFAEEHPMSDCFVGFVQSDDAAAS